MIYAKRYFAQVDNSVSINQKEILNKGSILFGV